jgi:diguanylate cyclase (GGDEF)-like protein
MTINRNKLAFIILTLLPILVVGVGSFWGNQRMLQGIADSVNAQERERTSLAIKSAFSALQDGYVGLVADNAPWQDAVDNTYGTPNLEWINDTWGLSTTDKNYDTVYVVTTDGTMLAGFQDGEQTTTPPQTYFGKGFAKLLEKMDGSNVDRLEISSLIETNVENQFAVIGLGRILPTEAGQPAPAEKPLVLVFSKRITTDRLATFSKQYGIDNLSLVKPEQVAPQDALLKSLDGSPVAWAKFSPRDPGSAARKANIVSAYAILFGLLALLIPISFAHFRLAKLLQSREAAARLAARHDSLSGLPNRVLLLEMLEAHQKSNEPEALSLLFVDLDGFKAVNDAYDHAAGDALIRKFGHGLLDLTMPHDLVARLGGDEFAILVRGKNVATRAEYLAHQIINYAQQPFDLEGKIASIGASVGIADWTIDITDSAEFMRQADIAMYAAKGNGRNNWCRFSPVIDKDRSEDLIIAALLREHLNRDGVNLAYQPIVDSKTHVITGVETLARWPGPENYPPQRFVRVAEEHGMIDAMFRKILVKAMKEIAPYKHIVLSVNVSAIQINNKNFVKDVVDASEASNFPLTRLELEFTETNLISNSKKAKNLMTQLTDLGIRVGLDDFGTGFASLGYLRDFSFNTIKLDQSLTQGVFKDNATQQFVQGTVTIAKGLSSDIIAEGVESKEQALFMNLAGCKNLQGYYFHRPSTLADLSVALDSEEENKKRA